MKKLLCILLTTPTWLFAGELWHWSKYNWTYTGKNGYTAEGFEWAPGYVSWTDNCGHRWEVWNWAPGQWDIEGNHQ